MGALKLNDAQSQIIHFALEIMRRAMNGWDMRQIL